MTQTLKSKVMERTIYSEPGIEVLEDDRILLIRCPKCHRENWALEVISGRCAWCGYNAYRDKEFIDRMFNKTLFNNRDTLNRLKD